MSTRTITPTKVGTTGTFVVHPHEERLIGLGDLLVDAASALRTAGLQGLSRAVRRARLHLLEQKNPMLAAMAGEVVRPLSSERERELEARIAELEVKAQTAIADQAEAIAVLQNTRKQVFAALHGLKTCMFAKHVQTAHQAAKAAILDVTNINNEIVGAEPIKIPPDLAAALAPTASPTSDQGNGQPSA